MDSIFVVMQSTIHHDAYDNFGDFLLGVRLGSLGFVNLYTFEYPDENDFGEEELVDIGYLSTVPLSEEEQTQIASALKVMREKGELNGQRTIDMDGKKVHLFAWYEDAIKAFEKQQQ